MNKTINMHQSNIVFEGLDITVEGFENKGEANHIMPIFYEEQPVTWEIYGEEILAYSPKQVLDVGCGSGFWSVLLKSQLPDSSVLGLDKNKKAIDYASSNAKKNSLDISLINAVFQDHIFEQQFDLIVLTPPYHIYPYSLENQIPFFARGGYDGQQEFYSQLKKSKDLLTEDGLILFNMMCVGNDDHPNYVNTIKNIFNENATLTYTNILPPMSSKTFIKELYDDGKEDYLQDYLTDLFPMLYYTSGLIQKGKGYKVRSDDYNASPNEDFDWCDRIQLHREINQFGK